MRRIAVAGLVALIVPLAFLAGRLAGPGGGDGARGRQVLYFVDPMNPAFRSPEPGTAPCGMPLEPVYADSALPDAAGAAPPGTVPVRADRLQLIGVAREAVRSRKVAVVTRLVGTVAADETRLYTISAATPGRALEMGTATTGSLVARGQVLGAYYAQELIVPQQNFIRIRETHDALRRTGVNVYDNLQGGTQLAAYERNLLYARQTLLNLGMSPEQIGEISASREVSYMVQIRAPAEGIVLARRLSLGQSFGVGDELFTIADLGSVWVLADALEGEERLYTPGMRATVTVPGTGHVFPAVVSRVLPQFEAATRTLKVRLEASNPGFILRPDMFVDVELPVEAGPALFVPREAVLDSGIRQAVFVEQEPGVFVPRTVRTGRRFGDRVEIVGGLMEGETVVTAGNFLLDSESRMRATGATRSDATLDPVCGMEVDEARAREAGLVSAHGGRTWFFCAAACKAAFDRDPQAAAAKAAGALAPEPASAPPAHAGTEAPRARPAVDPVCGMTVDEDEAIRSGLADTHRGATYFFCSSACKLAFGTNPAAVLAQPEEGRAMPGAPPAAADPAAGVGMPSLPGAMPSRRHTDLPAGAPGGLPGLDRDEGPEDGAVGWQTTVRAPHDPVCGMTVEAGRAAAAGLVSRHGPETYLFCSAACKKEFDADPSVFVQTSR